MLWHNVYKASKSVVIKTGDKKLFEEVRPEMRALIYFMVGMSLLGIGIILSQVDFALRFLGGP
jgi:hypothetical protein